MSKYETYKPSGIEWIGEVPLSWPKKRIKDFYSSSMGETILQEDLIDEGLIPVYSATESDTIFGYVNNASVILEPGDIVIPARGNSIGNSKIVDAKSTCTQTTIYCKQTSRRILPKFIYYYNYGLKDFLFHFDNTAIPQITVKQVSNNPIFLPTIEEQHTIANYLDDQTQKIDRLIANKKAQAEKLKELRQIEINNAVTKGLNPNVEMKDSGIEWLGKIPKLWELKKIKQLLKPEKNAIKTGPFGSDLKFEDLIEEGIKVYNQRSVLDNDWKSGEGYISAEKYESLKTCTIFPDDIVITTRGTIGKVSIFPADAELGILHPCLMRIQMNSQRILNDYLKIIINDSSFFFEALKLASNATTIDVIYSDSLKEVKIPVPPTNEQVEITTYLQKKVSAIDQLIKNIEAQIEKLQELRKIKIYDAVTGKIKVNAYAETTA